jgi:hypothetical protein
MIVEYPSQLDDPAQGHERKAEQQRERVHPSPPAWLSRRGQRTAGAAWYAFMAPLPPSAPLWWFSRSRPATPAKAQVNRHWRSPGRGRSSADTGVGELIRGPEPSHSYAATRTSSRGRRFTCLSRTGER